MKTFKKITVITPVYNQDELIWRALDSVPAMENIEHIVVNDGSTDKTKQQVQRYIELHPKKDITLLGWDTNKGVSYAINEGLDYATGEYVVLLGSDDYFEKDALKWIQAYLNGTDVVYFDIQDNTGHIRKLRPATINKYPGSVKFMRRQVIEDNKIRCPLERKRAEDVVFNQELLNHVQTLSFTEKVLKHYNYPRENSLTWNARNGVTDSIGNLIKEQDE